MMPLAHEVMRQVYQILTEFDPRGDVGWIVRQVTDVLSLAVRSLISIYGGGNAEACGARTWKAMRYIVEEAVRRVLMGVEVVKFNAWSHLLQPLRNLESRLLTVEEMNRLRW